MQVARWGAPEREGVLWWCDCCLRKACSATLQVVLCGQEQDCTRYEESDLVLRHSTCVDADIARGRRGGSMQSRVGLARRHKFARCKAEIERRMGACFLRALA